MGLQTGIDNEACDNHFRLEGVGYFRGHADAVQLGGIGEKKTPVNQASHLAVRQSVTRDKLKVARVTMIDNHGVEFGGIGINASLMVAGVGRSAPARWRASSPTRRLH